MLLVPPGTSGADGLPRAAHRGELCAGAADEEAGNLTDADLAEAETLTVTAKQKQRQALEDEVAAFLARGGRITEVPPDEHSDR